MARLGNTKGVRFQVNGNTISFVMNEIIRYDGENEYVENQCEMMVLGTEESIQVDTAEDALDFIKRIVMGVNSNNRYVERTVTELAYDYTKEDK